MDKILDLLLKDYTTVIQINALDGTFQEVKVDDNAKVSYTGINQRFIQFANSPLLYEADKKKFLEFANLGTIKEALTRKEKISFVYRKKTKQDELKWMKMICTKIDDTSILLTVRDVSFSSSEILPTGKRNYMEEFRELEESHAAIGLVLLEFNADDAKAVNAIIDKYYRSCYDVINYDDAHYVLYTLDKTRQECFPILAQFYNNFKDLNVSIGHIWEDEDWNFYSLITKASTNLQINK